MELKDYSLNNRKKEALVGGGVEVNQVRKAFDIAREGNHLGFRDSIGIRILERKIGKVKPESITKAVGNFWARRFPSESADARQIEKRKAFLASTGNSDLARAEGLTIMDAEKETIGSEAGVWSYEYIPSEKDATDEELEKIIFDGLNEALKQNEDGLRRIYEENSKALSEIGTFDEIRKNYPRLWINFLPKVRDPKTGQGFKDWNIYFDPKKGEYVKRFPDKTGVKDLFDVQIVGKGEAFDDRTEQIEDVMEKGLVAKVLLVKGDDGKIKNLEIYIPHATSDEEQGRKILKEVAKAVPISEKSDFGTRMNRKYQVIDEFDREKVNIFDLRNSFRLSKYEEGIIKEALAKFDPPMSLPVFLNQVWLGMNGEVSGYVCTAPNKPRREGEEIASGLQMALIPRIGEFNQLESVISGILSGNSDFAELTKFVNKFVEPLNKMSKFMEAELDRSKKALATTAILDAYISEADKKLFQIFFTRQSSLISAGESQISSVNFIDDQKEIPNLRNVIFTTALNLTAKEGLSLASFKGEKTVGIRFRTQRKMHDRVTKLLRENPNFHAQPNKDNYEALTKLVVEDDVKKFRKATVLLASGILGKNEGEIAEILNKLNDPSIVGEQNKNLI